MTMRIMMLPATLAAFVNPAAAAQRHGGVYYGNPDRGPYPASRFCEGSTCWRSSHQKVHHHK
jgi:hypothetical protein